MSFDFRSFCRFVRRWLPSIRWTPRRSLIVLGFFLLYPLLEILIWIGLWLDELLFQRYRRQPVDAPVFILGNFRSGTTFLHRLLSKDEQRFCTMAMWEILFSPSISGRKLVDGIVGLGRALGNPIGWIQRRIEAFWHEQSPFHEISLSEPEEDEYLLLHIWSALTIGLSSGLLDETLPYTYFDTRLPVARKRRIMGFYRRCVQRHLYARGGRCPATYLAKNPALTPKIESLVEHFPDAKIIYLVRNPLDAISSFVSMMNFSWEVMGAPPEGPALRNYLLGMAQHWYAYPLKVLDAAPADRYVIVNYDEMVRDPEAVVRSIYAHFDFTIDPAFEAVLREESRKASGYTSRHAYSLEALGLRREQIALELHEVFERFGFDTGELATNPEGDDPEYFV